LSISVLAWEASALILMVPALPDSLSARAVRSSRVALACVPSAVTVALMGLDVNLSASAFAASSVRSKSVRSTVREAAMDPASNVMAAHRPSPKVRECGGERNAGVNHYLVIYIRSTGTLLRFERYGDSREALDERFAAERKYRGDPDVEIVVLGADSVEALKRTHGRYFAAALTL
jgi:hypothetical protein